MRRKGSSLIVLGVLLMAASLLLNGYNVYMDLLAGRSSKNALNGVEELIGSGLKDYEADPYMEMPIIEVDGENYIGVLSIPALEKELPVLSSCDDRLLNIAPCRYMGSAYLDNMIICAHNSRAHFGALIKLQEGDGVSFKDSNGNVFEYTVIYTEIIGPDDVEKMVSGDWDLSLFGCTADAVNRVTVRLNKVSN